MKTLLILFPIANIALIFFFHWRAKKAYQIGYNKAVKDVIEFNKDFYSKAK